MEGIVGALSGKSIAGVVSIGFGAAKECTQIVERYDGNKVIAMVTFPVPQKQPRNFVFLRTAMGFISSLVYYKIRGARIQDYRRSGNGLCSKPSNITLGWRPVSLTPKLLVPAAGNRHEDGKAILAHLVSKIKPAHQ